MRDSRRIHRREGFHGTIEEFQCTYILPNSPALTVDWCDTARVKIDVLPDLVLLEIFNFYVGREGQKVEPDEKRLYEWCTLVHVCRKWRDLVFGSPRGLGIRLWYKAELPLEEELLDIWPPFPIVIWADMQRSWDNYDENIVAALEHNDRIGRIDLRDFPRSQLENILAAMHRPFPAMTFLQLSVDEDEIVSVIPDSFLGGSALQLQTLILDHIPFPGLPNLLLSATHLVELHLWRVHSVYLPPEMMLDCLSVLTRLKIFKFEFESPRRFDDLNSRHPPPPTRILLLPVLTEFWFRGLNEYSEALVARIDAPLLNKLDIILFHEPIIDAPKLIEFIDRAPFFKPYDKANVEFFRRDVWVELRWAYNKLLRLGISYEHSNFQLSSLVQVCRSSFPKGFIPAVEHLKIVRFEHRGSQNSDVIRVGDSQWVELLHPFIGVKSLYISEETVPRIAPALQELVGERVTEVLPALETISLKSGPVHEGIADFVSARQLSSHPISISYC